MGKGKELTRRGVVPARRRRLTLRNTMAFPRELREAIPDLPTCAGRILELDAVSGEAADSFLYGPGVHLRLVVKETGKLKGEFVVRMDLRVDAARALAARLIELAKQAEEMETRA